jgi:hypothetical protein
MNILAYDELVMKRCAEKHSRMRGGLTRAEARMPISERFGRRFNPDFFTDATAVSLLNASATDIILPTIAPSWQDYSVGSDFVYESERGSSSGGSGSVAESRTSDFTQSTESSGDYVGGIAHLQELLSQGVFSPEQYQYSLDTLARQRAGFLERNPDYPSRRRDITEILPPPMSSGDFSELQNIILPPN